MRTFPRASTDMYTLPCSKPKPTSRIRHIFAQTLDRCAQTVTQQTYMRKMSRRRQRFAQTLDRYGNTVTQRKRYAHTVTQQVYTCTHRHAAGTNLPVFICTAVIFLFVSAGAVQEGDAGSADKLWQFWHWGDGILRQAALCPPLRLGDRGTCRQGNHAF